MAGAGTVGFFVTMVADASQVTDGALTDVVTLGYAQPEYKSYTVEYVLSGAVIAGGVYLLFKGAKNKNKAKAANVFIDMEKAHVLQGSAFKNQSFPVVGLRVRL